MRDYAKVSPSFWTRGSGKKIKKDKNACILGLYFISCPSSNSLGLYYLPYSTIMHETPLTAAEVDAALVVLADSGFAFFDRYCDLVWVPNMAAIDLGDGKELGDRRRKGVENEIARIGNHDFVGEFSKKYATAYKLRIPYQVDVSECRIPLPGIKRVPDTPQNQEQEQEQEQEREGAKVFSRANPAALSLEKFYLEQRGGGLLTRLPPAELVALDELCRITSDPKTILTNYLADKREYYVKRKWPIRLLVDNIAEHVGSSIELTSTQKPGANIPTYEESQKRQKRRDEELEKWKIDHKELSDTAMKETLKELRKNLRL